MSSFVKVEAVVVGDMSEDIRKLIDNLEGSAKKNIFRKLAHVLVEDAKQSFDDPSNRPEPWKPRKSGGDWALLKKTGSLKNSIKLAHLNSDSAEITASPSYTSPSGTFYQGYAKFHQFGTKRIPARPFFALTKKGHLTDRMNSLFEYIINKELEKNEKLTCPLRGV